MQALTQLSLAKDGLTAELFGFAENSAASCRGEFKDSLFPPFISKQAQAS